MLSLVARLALTSTSIAPVLLTYAWVAFQSREILSASILATLCALLVLICLYILNYARTHLERLRFSAASIEAADRENIGFLLLYLLPLFTTDFKTLNWQVWAPAIIIFGLVVGTGYSYHFNPLLGILRWHFYKVDTQEGVTYVLITKKHLRNAADVLQVGQLTEYIVLDVG